MRRKHFDPKAPHRKQKLNETLYKRREFLPNWTPSVSAQSTVGQIRNQQREAFSFSSATVSKTERPTHFTATDFLKKSEKNISNVIFQLKFRFRLKDNDKDF